MRFVALVFALSLAAIAPAAAGGEAVAAPVVLTQVKDYELLNPKLTPEQLMGFIARANAGDAVACDLVFFSYFTGLGTKVDLVEARAWLKKARFAGGPLGFYYHGRCLQGFSLDPGNDPATGKKEIMQARAAIQPFAENGSAFFMAIMAIAVAMGDPASAFDWYMKSARRKRLGKLDVGERLFDNDPKLDAQVALKYLQESAEEGLAIACERARLVLQRSCKIGSCFQNGSLAPRTRICAKAKATWGCAMRECGAWI